MVSERAFFEQLASSMDHWVEAGVRSLTDPAADLTWTEHPEAFRAIAATLTTSDLRGHLANALQNLLYGQVHSVLVMFDGGTDLANETLLTITDSAGHTYSSGLHEQFVDHLFETGRMK